jgi:hypothetical protein
MERLSPATRISFLAGEDNRPRPHIHGVESGWGSKFWAPGDDDASTSSEEEEGLDSPGKRSYRSWFHGESNMPS